MKRFATGTALLATAAMAALAGSGTFATAATIHGHGHHSRPGRAARFDRGLVELRGTIVSYSATGGDVTGSGALIVTTRRGRTITLSVDGLTRIRQGRETSTGATAAAALVATARVRVAAELINANPSMYLALRVVVLPAGPAASPSASATGGATPRVTPAPGASG
ncbi:MAG TPA: hypothetical protein VMW47_07040 [Verrucomicrobiae bacterium]|nr:hypothetical protein [Verrucomicrobiae bacterium]